ncbi:tetratricopeptide repeat protein [Prochlorococcus marinus XMU1406]|uniref:tetratricopeptide repeat-containing sulfotransferase family protein n=1 Tax=Prochlorococcus marinus TaxID=1219 RepID=UPI001ADC9E2F|nr:tetratricopeptide repeat-containing sulfotransferase family protein [Prochlorococcus marinus]MBO8206614.1 tetratricopeptide repeat protein [Prochlorococcus marinus XMU1406]MCR8544334.1 tetratricopeptide repeat protein [Prochlorococcus marinus XMU1427]
MKGFGNNNRTKKKLKEKASSLQKDKLISNALALHSKGKIKEASEIYNFLIQNKIYDPRIFNNLGSIYSQIKQVDKAILLFEESIKKFPDRIEAYPNLANVLVAKGRSDTAKNILNKAIELNPKYLRSYSIMAGILVGEGNLQKAEFFLKKILEINPKDINALVNLACVLKDSGNPKQAEKFLKVALKINPSFDFALTNLGAVLNELEKFDEGEQCLRKALSINSSSPMALNNLGNILSNKKNNKEAELCYRKAIEIKSDFSIAYNNLGSLLSKQGNLIEAEKFTQKAINFNPKFELAYVNLGSIKIDLDKLKEAEELFLSAIEINEKYNYAYRNLFRLYEKTNKISKLKNKIESLNQNENVINEILMFKARIFFREKDFITAKKYIDQVSNEWIKNTDHSTNLLYWSFKAFIEEKVKNYDEAFKCFEKSQLNLKYETTNPKIFQNYIHTYRKNIDKDAFLVKTKDTKIIKESPVFLIGFPRSGTTLLDTILRSHPEIDVLEEKPLINSVEQMIKSKFKCSLDKLHQLTSKDLDYLRNHYLEILHNNCDNKNAKILIDKFPFQTVCLPLVNLLFPNSKIIFTHRNPYDTVLSCFQQSFEPNNAMANFRSIESASRIYDLTMSTWLDYKEKLKMNYITSKYEDLIEDFDKHILKILDFLDVTWDDNIKNYRNTANERGKINTPSSSQVVQPLYKSSINKWKNYEKYFKNSNQYLEKWLSYFEY